MMDIEKLIEQLNNLEFVAYGYNINGEVLGMECTEFECLMVDASTALSTLQAENEKLRAELERMKEIMRYNGIMVIPSKYPGGRSEWNIPKPRG